MHYTRCRLRGGEQEPSRRDTLSKSSDSFPI